MIQLLMLSFHRTPVQLQWNITKRKVKNRLSLRMSFYSSPSPRGKAKIRTQEELEASMTTAIANIKHSLTCRQNSFKPYTKNLC
jgi:hypothetical protein